MVQALEDIKPTIVLIDGQEPKAQRTSRLIPVACTILSINYREDMTTLEVMPTTDPNLRRVNYEGTLASLGYNDLVRVYITKEYSGSIPRFKRVETALGIEKLVGEKIVATYGHVKNGSDRSYSGYAK